MKPGLLLSALLLAAAGQATAERSLGTLKFSPCSLVNASAPTAVEAQCTRFKVPEDRTQPQGRQIELAIAWIPATAEAEADPLFLLAGGPGQSAREVWPMIATAFADAGRSRHVILVDQRGTGESNPLSCAEAGELEQIDESISMARAYAERCLADLSKRADVRFYTTTDAVADLDAVRAAIGAKQLNLVGVSYGTRVAQQYAKTFPAQTRSVVLDSAIDTTLVLGSEHARNLETALQAQFARCRAVPACAQNLGDPEALLRRIREQLAQPAQAAVRFRDSSSGEWHEQVPSLRDLVVLLRMYAYQSLTAAALPQILKQAADGDWAPLLAQSHAMSSNLGEQLMIGMQLSVMCSEDADELRTDPADANTVLGSEFVEFTKAQCEVWPRGTRPADFRTPLSGNVPVLLLAGEFDPVTPLRYAEAIASQLPNSRLLLLPGQGHSQLGQGCTPKLFAQFIEAADAKKLDTACLQRISPTPPFTGLYGWDP